MEGPCWTAGAFGIRRIRERSGQTDSTCQVHAQTPSAAVARTTTLEAALTRIGVSPRRFTIVATVLFRQGLARLLEDGGVEIAAAVDDADALVRRIRADQPDVAIVDIRMPPTHTTEGIRAAIEIRSEFPDVGVLVLSQHVETEYAVELLRDTGGSVGYLLKDRVTDPGEILDALRRISEGETVVDSDLVARLLGRSRQSSPLDSLTKREREVLAAMAEGRTNQGIADALFMSPKTVETHTRSIFQKLDLLPGDDYHRRVVAAVTWLREQ